MTRRKRRADYAEKLATARKAAVIAYCEQLGSPRTYAAQVKRVAKDAVIEESTFQSYLSGLTDLSRDGCQRLEDELTAKGKDIRTASSNPLLRQHGVWIFGDPDKSRFPYMPTGRRESRAAAVFALMQDYCRDVGADITTEEVIFKKLSLDSGLAYNAVLFIARGFSYFSAKRLACLQTKLQEAQSQRDISMLGEDPRGWQEQESVSQPGSTPPAPANGEATSEPMTALRSFAGVLHDLGENDVLIVDGQGRTELFRGEQAVVIVLRPGESMAVLTPPAGAKLEQGMVLTGGGEKGVISVPFSPLNNHS